LGDTHTLGSKENSINKTGDLLETSYDPLKAQRISYAVVLL